MQKLFFGGGEQMLERFVYIGKWKSVGYLQHSAIENEVNNM